MSWRCVWLPWHRVVLVQRLSRSCDYFRCSCGRDYGVNHDVKTVLPWAQVRSVHEAPTVTPVGNLNDVMNGCC